MSKTTLGLLIALLLAGTTFSHIGCESADEAEGSDGDDDDDNDDAVAGDSDADSDGDADGDADGDGDVDTENNFCDCPDVGDGSSVEQLASAMNICPGPQIIEAAKWSSSPNAEAGYAVLDSMGTNDCLVHTHGCQMIALSTGPVGQADPNSADSMAFGDGMADIGDDPLPPYQGENPTSSTPYATCDVVQLQFVLEAPDNAEGFSFDFVFASAEYDEWINMGYNDAFYAILEYGDLNGGEPTNISFDDNGNEIEVDVNFFENPAHPCDETGSGWEPGMPSVSGSTGWLRTQWPVAGGSSMRLTFSIHDEGDCVWDSIVFIDNFQWLGDPVEGGTTPLE